MLHKQYIQNGKFEKDSVLLETFITELNELIPSTKKLYYEKNLWKKRNNPLLQAKMDCSILKTFYNNNKIQLIPPLLVKVMFVADNKTILISITFFAEQNTPLKSILPTNQIFLTESSLDFNEDNIFQITRNLNIYKAHGHDDISIRMIKLCNKSLLKPLIFLFYNLMKSCCYPDIWKMIPIHKKSDST